MLGKQEPSNNISGPILLTIRWDSLSPYEHILSLIEPDRGINEALCFILSQRTNLNLKQIINMANFNAEDQDKNYAFSFIYPKESQLYRMY